MDRRNKILLIVLVLQIAVIAFSYRPRSQDAPAEKKFFAGLTEEEVNRINITGKDGDSLSFTRTVAGDWQVDEKNGYPGDVHKINDLLDKLLNLSSTRLVTRTKASHLRLEVSEADFVRKVTLTSENGGQETLFVGSSPNYKTSHVRLAEDSEVYLVQDLSPWEMMPEPDSWWQTNLTDIPDTKIDSITMTTKAGSFTLQKNGAGSWQLSDSEAALDIDAVTGFLDKAGHISLTKYEGKTEEKGFGLDDPVATLAINTAGKDIIVTIGPLVEATNDHVVKMNRSPFYVRVSKYVLEPLLDKKPEDFIAAAPAEESQIQEKEGEQ